MKENEMMTCQGHMTKIDDDEALKDVTMPKGSMVIRWHRNSFGLVLTWSTFWFNDDQVWPKDQS